MTAQETPALLFEGKRFVGDIEPLGLDGTIHFFGFSYRDDLVLSPLIQDPDVMARYAAAQMNLTDGVYPESEWREMTDEAAKGSNLGDHYQYETAPLREAGQRLKQLAETGEAAGPVEINYHLFYLLASATRWEVQRPNDPDVTDVLKRLSPNDEIDWFEIARVQLKKLSDEFESMDSDQRRDAAIAIRAYLTTAAPLAPATWSELFPLVLS